MNKKLDQRGAVSIISVVIFATIITVLITAYLRSAVSQQAEAQSYDFSTRAYYTAESGVQDTIRIMKSDATLQNNKDACKPFNANSSGAIGGGDFGLKYTCQMVKFDPVDISGVVEPNKQNALIELQPQNLSISNPKIVVRWSEQYNIEVSSVLNDQKLYPRSSGVTLPVFSQQEKWFAGGDTDKPIHALLRVVVVTQPRGAAPYSRGDITQQVVFMNPTNSLNKDSDVNFTTPGSVQQQQEQLFNNAECYPSDNVTGSNMKTYSCKQTINISTFNFNNKRVYIRVGSVYRSTGFSVELLNGSGVTVPLQNAQAEIDITARAGQDTYRRIKQKVSLGGYKTDAASDAALVSGEGICKLLTLGKIPEAYKSDCNPLTD